MAFDVGRRQFISALGGAGLAWTRTARAQQTAPALPDVVEPLVSVSWLKAHLAKNLIVLDTRLSIDGNAAAAFATGHIPGAVYTDYDRAGWRTTRRGLPLMLPSIAQLETLIGELGIDEGSRVVVVPEGVDATDFGSAARVYWTLKVSGIKDVSILDGGFAAWCAVPDNPVDIGMTHASPTIFVATIDKKLLAELDEVETIERMGGATLVDARPVSFFLGNEKVPVVKGYGHIPHSLNLDSTAFYDNKTNRLKPIAELAKIASRLPEGPIVTYCNSGHWSATEWFVLSEVLHRTDVKLYYGSMIEWTSDPRRRVGTAP
jgi:thiosulfate/3-mercaptopyruvate sulfurtransferase